MSILCSLAFLSIDQNSQIFFKPGNLNWTYMGELFVLGSLGICAVWMVTVSCQLLDPTINSVKIFLKNKIYFFKFFTNIQIFWLKISGFTSSTSHFCLRGSDHCFSSPTLLPYFYWCRICCIKCCLYATRKICQTQSSWEVEKIPLK